MADRRPDIDLDTAYRSVRAWRVAWIDANDPWAEGLILCDGKRCDQPMWVRESHAHDGSTHVGFWVQDEMLPAPELHGYLFATGKVGSHASGTITPIHSALVEVPEPSQSHLYAAALITLALLHRGRRAKRRRS